MSGVCARYSQTISEREMKLFFVAGFVVLEMDSYVADAEEGD